MNSIIPKKSNGRIHLEQPNTAALFSMYERVAIPSTNEINGAWESSPLSMAFFSNKNINILQNGIRAGVYEKTNQRHIIDKQDIDQLKIIMKSIYLEHATHNPTNITEQITKLNTIVLNYCIEQVYIELISYLKYINDITTMQIPMDRPVPTDGERHKQLEEKHFY
jgi:hypothetical protein